MKYGKTNGLYTLPHDKNCELLKQNILQLKAKITTGIVTVAKSKRELRRLQCALSIGGEHDDMVNTRKKITDLRTDIKSINSLLQTDISSLQVVKNRYHKDFNDLYLAGLAEIPLNS